MTEDSKITHTPNIKLNKLSAGNYSWEIRIADEDIKSIPQRLKEVDDEMLELFHSIKTKRGEKK